MSEKEKNTRFLVEVPAPGVTFSLGQPEEKFGYPGISMKSAKGLFIDVAGQSVFSHAQGVAHIASACYSFFTKKDFTVSTGMAANVMSKRMLVLGAGAGYMEDTDPGGGDAVFAPDFNRSDFEDIVEPCLDGLKAFDGGAKALQVVFDNTLGHASNAAVVQANAHAAGGKLARLKALIFGGHGDPTANSLYIEEFVEEAGGLLGLLQKMSSKLNRLDRALQRPETIPFVGPIMFGKLKQARDMVNTAMGVAEEAKELAELPIVGIEKAKVAAKRKDIEAKKKTLKETEDKIAANEAKLKANEAKLKANEKEIRALEKEEKQHPSHAREKEIKARLAILEKENKTLETDNETIEKENKELEKESKKLEKETEELEEEANEADEEFAKKYTKPFVDEWKRYKKDINAAGGKDADGKPLKDPEEAWKRPGAAMKAASVDIVHMMRPVRNLVRTVQNLTFEVAELVEQVGAFLGILPPAPSALGLVAQHGVSMITPDRVFGYAADGFHFVSADVAKPDPTGAFAKLRAAQKALKDKMPTLGNFLFGRSVPRPPPRPGFVVETSGAIELKTSNDINLQAQQAGSNVRVRATDVIEVSTNRSVGIASRTGAAELTGKNVYLGIPLAVPLAPADATPIARKAMPLVTIQAMVQAANQNYDDARDALDDSERTLSELEDDAAELVAKAQASRDMAVRIQLAAQLKAKEVQIDVANGNVELKKQMVAAAKTAKKIADEMLSDATGSVDARLDQSLVNGPRAQATNQALAETIGLAALNEVSVYSPTKVAIESKELVLTGQDLAIPATPLTPPSTIKAGNSQVSIEVGKWTVTIKPDGVSITKAGGASIEVHDFGVTINASNGDLKLKSVAAGINAKTCDISGDVITLG